MSCDVIRLLPDSVANQIAAGEVIQRPASVVKELVENAVDAGATAIEIIIKDGGRTLIQVVDNGKGMSPTDARMAFERHATSKITSARDLYSLHTMGFRGEALPSIAAVAQIDLRTMQPGDIQGTRLQLSESQFVSQEPCACRPGCNMMVKNLFFNLPARRKFLKSDKVEKAAILQEFTRLVLVNTDVEFTFVYDDKTERRLLRGNLRERIGALLGKQVGNHLVPVATETPIVRINGYVGLPQAAVKGKPHQFFFVNGRNMRHPYFQKAVLNCYEGLISSDVQPHFFINIEVDPATIDVNIHPQKHEVKFEHEQPIWQILNAAVKQALGRVNAAGAIDFDPGAMNDIPVFMPDRHAEMPSIATDDSYNPFADDTTPAGVPSHGAMAEMRSGMSGSGSRTFEMRSPGVPRDWDKLFDAFTARRDAPADVPSHDSVPDVGPSDTSAPVVQPELPLRAAPDSYTAHLTVDRRYIILPTARGLMVIDRYRAHMRVLFDDFMESMVSRPLASQQLIFPETVTLTPAQSAVMSTMDEILGHLGYDVSFLGDSTWAVNAVPAISGNPVETLVSMAADLAESGELSADDLLRPAALALARSAAIKPGTELTSAETEVLVARLLASDNAAYTPDGRPTYSTVTTDFIAKLFT